MAHADMHISHDSRDSASGLCTLYASLQGVFHSKPLRDLSDLGIRLCHLFKSRPVHSVFSGIESLPPACLPSISLPEISQSMPAYFNTLKAHGFIPYPYGDLLYLESFPHLIL